MTINIPEGMANVTWILQAVGSTRVFTTSLGVAAATGSLPAPAAIAESVYNDSVATSRPFENSLMSSKYSFLGVSVTKTVSGLPLVGTFLATLPGTNTLMPPPPNTTLLLKKVTSSGGRKNRGRMYVAPANLGENKIDQLGAIDADVVTPIQEWWNNLLSDIEADGFTPVLFHSDTTTPTTITSLSLESLVATQRRRMR